MNELLMLGVGFVGGVAVTATLAMRWYERPQDWCGGTDGAVYLAGYQHGRRDGAKPPETDRDPSAVMWVPEYPRAARSLVRWP